MPSWGRVRGPRAEWAATFNDPLEKARNECHSWINRANSVDKLGAMARVLKALSAD